MKKKRCFLCGRSNNLKDFNEVNFEKCKRMKIFREKKKFKYYDINFPEKMNDAAYHSECLSKFAVLKQKYKQEFEMIFQNGNVLPNTPDMDLEENSRSKENELPNPSQAFINSDVKKSKPIVLSYPDFNIKDYKEEQSCAEKDQSMSQPQTDKCSEVEKSNLIEENTSIIEEKNTTDSKWISISEVACIFCEKIRKKVKNNMIGTSICSSQDSIDKMKKYAEIIGDDQLVKKLNQCTHFRYHKTCKNNFIRKYDECNKSNKKDEPESNWHIIRKFHNKTFQVFCQFIESEILKNEKCFLLTDLNCQYKKLFLELNSDSTEDDIESYTANKLQDKLLNTYGDKITICYSPEHKSKKIVFKNT